MLDCRCGKNALTLVISKPLRYMAINRLWAHPLTLVSSRGVPKYTIVVKALDDEPRASPDATSRAAWKPPCKKPTSGVNLLALVKLITTDRLIRGRELFSQKSSGIIWLLEVCCS